jgi:hypothetical protein
LLNKICGAADWLPAERRSNLGECVNIDTLASPRGPARTSRGRTPPELLPEPPPDR